MSRAGDSIGAWRRVLLSALFLLCLAPRADAAESAVEAVRIGFDDAYKLGYWTPIEIDLRAGEGALVGQLEVVVPDGDGVLVRYLGPSVNVAAGQASTASMCIKIGRPQARTTVSIRQSGRTLEHSRWEGEAPRPLAPGQELILTLGNLPELDAANRLASQEGAAPAAVRALKDFHALPEDWQAYDGIDSLILTTSRPDELALSNLQGEEARLTALNQWVEMGGRVILSAGKQPAALAPGSPLSRFVPGRFDRLTTLPQAGPVEAYAVSPQPLPLEQGELGGLQTPRLVDVEGRIEAFYGNRPTDLPLVVRAARGFGEVVFVALDLDQTPLAGWAGLPRMLNKLLGRAPAAVPETSTGGEIGRQTHEDLLGQLRSSLNHFPDVPVISFWAVAGLGVLYILVIGPLDYFLLRWVERQRPYWTLAPWITLGISVALFGVGAYELGRRVKGNEVRIRQAAIIDIDAARPASEPALVRGTAWVCVFSPENETYNLSLSLKGGPLGATAAGQRGLEEKVSWLGLPGTMIGGMNAAALGQAPLAYPYTALEDGSALQSVPVSIGSTKDFTADWRAQLASPVEAELVPDPHYLLAGTIANRSQVPLTNCVLFYDRWAYLLGEIAPGAVIRLERRFDPRTVEAYLTRQTAASGREAPTYDPQAVDLSRILQTMMFHEAAGGRNYTRMFNRSEQRLDLSGRLQLGRAILVASAPPGARLMLQGPNNTEKTADPDVVFYRFLFNVAKTPTATEPSAPVP